MTQFVIIRSVRFEMNTACKKHRRAIFPHSAILTMSLFLQKVKNLQERIFHGY